MGMVRSVGVMLAAVLAGMSLLPAPALSAGFDHSLYDRILRRYVDEEGLVNYDGIRQNALNNLKQYLNLLAQADPSGLSRNERLAFWINAYNANMINFILANPGLKKVSDRFDLFDTPARVAGGSYTLNDIENRVIRGKINKKNGLGPVPGVSMETLDPRIHFALVCAAMDCPKLQNFAYTAENLESTLRAGARRFANIPKHLALENGNLKVSTLMKWYEEDFKGLGGVGKYLMALTDPAIRKDETQVDRLLAGFPARVRFEYDWTVNDVRNARK